MSNTPKTEFGGSSLTVSLGGVTASEIESLQLTISGPGINQPLTEELAYVNGAWRGIITEIPVGINRVFSASAFRLNQGNPELIYQGAADSVEVKAGQTVSVIIMLQEANPPLPQENTAPKLNSLTASSASVAPGETVNLVANAEDPNPEDVLTYQWTGSDGAFSVNDAASTTWTAPATEGTYTLTLRIADNHDVSIEFNFTLQVANQTGGGAEVTIGVNHSPIISSLNATPAALDRGQNTNLSLTAVDPDGDPLTYNWTTNCTGTFDDTSSPTPIFTVDPAAAYGLCKLSATVSDDRGGSSEYALNIQIAPPLELSSPPEILTLFQSAITSDGENLVFRVTAKTSANPPLNFQWQFSAGTPAQAVETVDGETYKSQITWTPPELCSQSTIISVTVSNAAGLSVMRSFQPVELFSGCQSIPPQANGIHPIFTGTPGVPVTPASLDAVANDATGLNIKTDYDGDGLPNSLENIAPYGAQTPSIEAYIATPITLTIIGQDSGGETVEYSDAISSSMVLQTRGRAMKDWQYHQLKTNSVEYTTAEGNKLDYFFSDYLPGGTNLNDPYLNSFQRSNMAGTSGFAQMNADDSAGNRGLELTDGARDALRNNLNASWVKQAGYTKTSASIRFALYLENHENYLPMHFSNIELRLVFRKPTGEIIPVQEFTLENEPGSPIELDLYGGGNFGPYVAQLSLTNPDLVEEALENGYMPQLELVSFSASKTQSGSQYPEVTNLAPVAETIYQRTAQIKIRGKAIMWNHRTPAFEINAQGLYSPGISLKRALFNLYQGSSDVWDENTLTVRSEGRNWITGASQHNYALNGDGSFVNTEGNSWNSFETDVQSYTDENNVVHRIETIKRLGGFTRYNPFLTEDNPGFDPTLALTDAQANQSGYFVIFHNGHLFQGDLNDPIWAGERYEIVFFEAEDFSSYFTP